MKKQAVRCVYPLLSLIALCVLPIAGLAQTPGNPNSPSAPGRGGGGAIAHTIRGKIFLPSGHLPEQRIRVVLELNTGGVAGETFSDSVGNFEFRSLPSNSYKVSVPSDGRTYDTTQEIVELYGNFSRTFMVQINLKEKGGDFVYKTKDKILSVADLQEVPKGAKKAYEKGSKRAQENKPEEAVASLQEAINIFPEYLFAINKLGEQYLAMNKLTEAQTSFEKAIAINPKFALPHINLGIVMVNQKRFDEAVSEFESGNKLDDSYPMSHLTLGLALMSLNPPDFDRAEKEMTRALDLGGKSFIHARKYLFNLNIRRKNMDKAAAQLEAYLKEAPNAPDAEDVRQMLAKVKKAINEQQGSAKQ